MFDFFLFNELQKSAARHESSSQRSSHSSYGSSDSYMECDCDCDWATIPTIRLIAAVTRSTHVTAVIIHLAIVIVDVIGNLNL